MINVKMINEGMIDKAVLPVSSFGAPCHSSSLSSLQPPYTPMPSQGILANLNLRNKLQGLEDALPQKFCLGCDLINRVESCLFVSVHVTHKRHHMIHPAHMLAKTWCLKSNGNWDQESLELLLSFLKLLASKHYLHRHQYDQMASGRLSCVTRDSGGSVRLLPNGGVCSCYFYLLLLYALA